MDSLNQKQLVNVEDDFGHGTKEGFLFIYLFGFRFHVCWCMHRMRPLLWKAPNSNQTGQVILNTIGRGDKLQCLESRKAALPCDYAKTMICAIKKK